MLAILRKQASSSTASLCKISSTNLSANSPCLRKFRILSTSLVFSFHEALEFFRLRNSSIYCVVRGWISSSLVRAKPKGFSMSLGVVCCVLVLNGFLSSPTDLRPARLLVRSRSLSCCAYSVGISVILTVILRKKVCGGFCSATGSLQRSVVSASYSGRAWNSSSRKKSRNKAWVSAGLLLAIAFRMCVKRFSSHAKFVFKFGTLWKRTLKSIKRRFTRLGAYSCRTARTRQRHVGMKMSASVVCLITSFRTIRSACVQPANDSSVICTGSTVLVRSAPSNSKNCSR